MGLRFVVAADLGKGSLPGEEDFLEFSGFDCFETLIP